MGTNNWRGYGGPAKYLQGDGLLEELPAFAAQLGETAFLLVDVFFFAEFEKRFAGAFRDAGIPAVIRPFEGEITQEKIRAAVEDIKDAGIGVVVAIGGGRTIDTGKMISRKLGGLPLIVSPTTASTDAPCSAMAMVYTEEGLLDEVAYGSRNPDLVLVDSGIIAKAPPRFLVSGMGDAIATYIEARASLETNSANYISCGAVSGFRPTLLGQAAATWCYEIVLRDGEKALRAVEARVVSEALENVIEANTLLSGLGFENVGCAGAHSLGNAMGAFGHEKGSLHGEKVAFGALCQLHLENRPGEEIDALMDFYRKVGLPWTLEDLGIPDDEETLRDIAGRSYPGVWGAHKQLVTPEIIVGLMRIAQQVGKNYR